jgi:hypothetical protein
MLDVYKAFTELFIDANLVSILDDTHLVTASHLARDVDLHVVAAKSFNLLHEFILFGFIRLTGSTRYTDATLDFLTSCGDVEDELSIN